MRWAPLLTAVTACTAWSVLGAASPAYAISEHEGKCVRVEVDSDPDPTSVTVCTY